MSGKENIVSIYVARDDCFSGQPSSKVIRTLNSSHPKPPPGSAMPTRKVQRFISRTLALKGGSTTRGWVRRAGELCEYVVSASPHSPLDLSKYRCFQIKRTSQGLCALKMIKVYCLLLWSSHTERLQFCSPRFWTTQMSS